MLELSASIWAALLLGLAGSTHCISMCGGVHASLSVQKDNKRPTVRAIAFSSGRIMSYGLVGLIVGSASFAVQSIHPGFGIAARLIAGLMLIAMALYIGRWWMGLTALEKIGRMVWRHIQPITQSFTPAKSVSQTFALGMLWGWLPCGLVYSALAWASQAAHPTHTAVLMLSFGLGTLPSMLGITWLAQQARAFFSHQWVRQINAAMLLIFALWTLYTPLQMLGNNSPHPSHTPNPSPSQHSHH